MKKEHLVPRVIHVFNGLNESSGPFDRVKELTRHLPDLEVISYAPITESAQKKIKHKKYKVSSIQARNNYDITAWYKLMKRIKRGKYDIVHTHHNFTGLLVRILSIFIINIKVVHNIGTQFSEIPLIPRLLHIFTFPLLDAVVFVSRSSMDSMSFLGQKMMPKHSKVILNGVKFSEVVMEKNNRSNNMLTFKNDAEILVGSVSRLIALKDQATLLMGVAETIRRGRNIKLIITGAGNHRRSLEQLAARLGIEQNVLFTGFVERKKVYQILYSLDIFIMTSLWEGLSVALLQAMAAERPIIATDIPSIREVIDDGITGRLIPVKNPQKLADAIDEICENHEAAKAWGEKARQIVEERFSIQATATSYHELYNSLYNV